MKIKQCPKCKNNLLGTEPGLLLYCGKCSVIYAIKGEVLVERKKIPRPIYHENLFQKANKIGQNGQATPGGNNS